MAIMKRCLQSHPKETLVLLAAALVTAGPLLPLLAHGYVGSTDLLFYSRALDLFSHQLWGGELYPRFLSAANAGFGSPVFYFYPPLAFYLTSLFEPLRDIDPDGFYRLSLGIFAASFVSGLTCRCWLLYRYTPREAFWGALIYMLLPYRLFYMYFDFGLAQCWALALLPVLFLSIDRLRAGRPNAPAACALAYALILLTHIPSFIVIVPVSFAYAFFCGSQKPDWRPLVLLGLALLLGIGLADFFLLPLLANRDAIDESAGLSGKLLYSNNFATIPFCMSAPFIALAILWFLRNAGAEANRRMHGFFILVGLLLFMMTPLSKPLWDVVPPLHYLQFPVGRFYAPLLLMLAVLGLEMKGLLRSWLACAILALYVGLHLLHVWQSYDYQGWPAAWTPERSHVQELLQKNRYILPPEYRTRWTDPQAMRLAALAEAKGNYITSGSGIARVVAEDPRNITVHASVLSPSGTLILHRFYFPGWRATGSNGSAFSVYPDPHSGLIAVLLPKGEYNVTARLDNVPGERTGAVLSLISACLMGLWLLRGRSGKPV